MPKKSQLSDRNQNWIERGQNQKNCRQGKKCLVAVGLTHLVAGDNNLIELLTQGRVQDRKGGVAEIKDINLMQMPP